MNRKLYDENQQFKERNIEQRQQIEHFHTLFQENKQQNEQTLNQLRKERDEAYQRENELSVIIHAIDEISSPINGTRVVVWCEGDMKLKTIEQTNTNGKQSGSEREGWWVKIC